MISDILIKRTKHRRAIIGKFSVLSRAQYQNWAPGEPKSLNLSTYCPAIDVRQNHHQYRIEDTLRTTLYSPLAESKRE